jgi:hypothetical protein
MDYLSASQTDSIQVVNNNYPADNFKYSFAPFAIAGKFKVPFKKTLGEIHQIVIRTLSGFRYLCKTLAYLVFSRIFVIARKIGESLGSSHEYSAKSAGKQEEEFLMAVLEKN